MAYMYCIGLMNEKKTLQPEHRNNVNTLSVWLGTDSPIRCGSGVYCVELYFVVNAAHRGGGDQPPVNRESMLLELMVGEESPVGLHNSVHQKISCYAASGEPTCLGTKASGPVQATTIAWSLSTDRCTQSTVSTGPLIRANRCQAQADICPLYLLVLKQVGGRFQLPLQHGAAGSC
ncbi:unnamed protein product [Ectocarpus sp. 13 AM-2016]